MDKVFGYMAQCRQRNEVMHPFMTLYAIWGDSSAAKPYMAHKFGWFTASLRGLLQRAGMREIKIMTPNYHFAFRDMRAEAIK
jgi:hypothetical protein